ncbi:MAG TPA: glycosyltransferase family 4 protein [Anaerolineaceae bacterium]|nr:glycosyltransferase family 4 protein [Anaerolineaceae bacterium]
MGNISKQPTAPIHVLEVIGNAITGGMETSVYRLAQHLPSYGFKITCLAPYESAYTSKLRALGCDVFVTQMDINPPWRSLQFAAEIALHNQVDLIHANLPRAHALAGIVGKLTDKPVVATIHGMDLTIEDLSIANMTGSHLIVVCQAAYAQALALGIPPNRCALIPNGVDIRAFHPEQRDPGFRRKIGVPKSAPLVGFVGRIDPEKGPDLFIQLARHIHHQQPHVHFAMVGNGHRLEEIQNMILDEDLTKVVHLYPPTDEIASIYPSFDVLALTSRVEGMPLVLLEAMACSVPTAALAVGGVAEIIEVGSSGLLAAPGDWMGLAEAVITLLADPKRRIGMGEAARKRVEDIFDLSKTIRDTATTFRKLVFSSSEKVNGISSQWEVAQKTSPEMSMKPLPNPVKKDD